LDYRKCWNRKNEARKFLTANPGWNHFTVDRRSGAAVDCYTMMTAYCPISGTTLATEGENR